ncbi:hypothetical protein ADUPG1_013493 [Aduncisulcus paluster]|uniref:Uncharacterized protein n=1 Tax=Aduncisulcus paluster TaxID=2918883 RepID=A0ABQ5K346_9EUKA|nr:hypothetical protein ADUPG1_013493 [Aduncisulcus paluster]
MRLYTDAAERQRKKQIAIEASEKRKMGPHKPHISDRSAHLSLGDVSERLYRDAEARRLRQHAKKEAALKEERDQYREKAREIRISTENSVTSKYLTPPRNPLRSAEISSSSNRSGDLSGDMSHSTSGIPHTPGSGNTTNLTDVIWKRSEESARRKKERITQMILKEEKEKRLVLCEKSILLARKRELQTGKTLQDRLHLTFEEMRKDKVKEQEEKLKKECTFVPMINKGSEAIDKLSRPNVYVSSADVSGQLSDMSGTAEEGVTTLTAPMHPSLTSSISPVSRVSYRQQVMQLRHEKHERLIENMREQIKEKEIHECTFQPKLMARRKSSTGNSSSIVKDKLDYDMAQPMHERTKHWHEKKKQKNEKHREEKKSHVLDGCTFMPDVSKSQKHVSPTKRKSLVDRQKRLMARDEEDTLAMSSSSSSTEPNSPVPANLPSSSTKPRTQSPLRPPPSVVSPLQLVTPSHPPHPYDTRNKVGVFGGRPSQFYIQPSNTITDDVLVLLGKWVSGVDTVNDPLIPLQKPSGLGMSSLSGAPRGHVQPSIHGAIEHTTNKAQQLGSINHGVHMPPHSHSSIPNQHHIPSSGIPSSGIPSSGIPADIHHQLGNGNHPDGSAQTKKQSGAGYLSGAQRFSPQYPSLTPGDLGDGERESKSDFYLLSVSHSDEEEPRGKYAHLARQSKLKHTSRPSSSFSSQLSFDPDELVDEADEILRRLKEENGGI